MKRYRFVFLILIGALMVASYPIYKKYHHKNSPGKKRFSSVSDNKVYPALCKAIALDERLFANFRREPFYNLILENTTFEEGEQCVKLIAQWYPSLFEKWEEFRKNDTVGNPRVFEFPGAGTFSPSTLRYVKIAGDLQRAFGDMNGWKVIEIGGGYGGQCKILSNLCRFGSYTIVDLPEALLVAKKFLEQQGIKNVTYLSPDEVPSGETYDLVFSSYGFSECDAAIQNKYLEKILKHSRCGFLICNTCPKHFRVRPISKEHLMIKLKKFKFDCAQLPEEPLRGKDNYVLIWKSHYRG